MLGMRSGAVTSATTSFSSTPPVTFLAPLMTVTRYFMPGTNSPRIRSFLPESEARTGSSGDMFSEAVSRLLSDSKQIWIAPSYQPAPAKRIGVFGSFAL